MGRPNSYGEGFVSVTEVISVLNKPFLVPWASKVTAEKIKECLTDKEKSWTLDEAVEAGKKAPIIIRDSTGDTGKKIHKAVEDYLRDKTIDKELSEKELMIFQKFKEYVDEQQLTVLLQEQPIYHRGYMFAGTPDLICLGPEIRDWKIKTKVDRYELGLQLGGYSLLCKEKFGERAKRAEGFCVNRAGKAFKPIVYEDLKEWEEKFLNLLKVFRDKENS
jgi:hypothetical protein